MNVLIFWASLAIFSYFLVFFMVRQNDWGDTTKAEEAIQEARRLYIETGQKNREFRALSRTLVETAERSRNELLKLELVVREKATYQFTAVCACPKCGEIDVHWIEDLWLGHGHRSIIRRCRQCDHGWYQA